MFPAARIGVDTAGGPLTTPLQTTVFAGGSLWAVMGTTVSPHAPGPHAAATVVKASTTVYVGGIPACRASDLASCGCPVTPGCPTVLAGG